MNDVLCVVLDENGIQFAKFTLYKPFLKLTSYQLPLFPRSGHLCEGEMQVEFHHHFCNQRILYILNVSPMSI